MDQSELAETDSAPAVRFRLLGDTLFSRLDALGVYLKLGPCRENTIMLLECKDT